VVREKMVFFYENSETLYAERKLADPKENYLEAFAIGL
jgi:hypothetical protein